MHLYCQYKYQFNRKHYYEWCAFKYVVTFYFFSWLIVMIYTMHF